MRPIWYRLHLAEETLDKLLRFLVDLYRRLVVLCIAFFDWYNLRKPRLRPATRRAVYRLLIASGQYTWRQFGTRVKARQAARKASWLAFNDWGFYWRGYLRHILQREV